MFGQVSKGDEGLIQIFRYLYVDGHYVLLIRVLEYLREHEYSSVVLALHTYFGTFILTYYIELFSYILNVIFKHFSNFVPKLLQK